MSDVIVVLLKIEFSGDALKNNSSSVSYSVH